MSFDGSPYKEHVKVMRPTTNIEKLVILLQTIQYARESIMPPPLVWIGITSCRNWSQTEKLKRKTCKKTSATSVVNYY